MRLARPLALTAAAVLAAGLAAPAAADDDNGAPAPAENHNSVPADANTPAGDQAPADADAPAGDQAPADADAPAGDQAPADADAPAGDQAPADANAPASNDTEMADLTIELVNRESVSATSSAIFQGTGCVKNGKPGSITLYIGTDENHFTSLDPVKAMSDGNWTVTVDMAKATAAAAGDVKTDPWSAQAVCIFEDGTQLDEATSFELTHLSGHAQIVTDGSGKQTIQITDGQGFNPNISVQISLVPATQDGKPIDGAAKIGLGALMTDENGNLTGEVAVPGNLADGFYTLQLDSSAPEGESAFLDKAVYVAKDGALRSNKTSDDSNGADTDKPAGTDKPADTGNAAPAAPAAHKETKTGPGNQELAKTGVATPAIGLLALGLVGAGAFAVKRRNA